MASVIYGFTASEVAANRATLRLGACDWTLLMLWIYESLGGCIEYAVDGETISSWRPIEFVHAARWFP